ncbi:MAG: histidine--tRNA ligase [Bacteroidetes bacterium]|nr:histidine--tRNA ligase [Bacteroidota bacterium]
MTMKPSIPRGTRDMNPAEMQKRNYIFDVIKKYFRLYGFEQIETPAMENLSSLTGKYGEEGDQLLFKILNSRIHESTKKEELLNEFTLSLESSRNTDLLTERALRYDLTVPFARYVVMHQNEITFPFKRFQIQPVWRADKPQKGRYREFFQCDADMIGSNSLLNEIDLVKLMDDVYTDLKLATTIKINNRKILSGLAEMIGAPDKIVDITVAIDKLDKIGEDKVIMELLDKGLSEEAISKLKPVFSINGSNEEKLISLEELLVDSEVGKKGIQEIAFVLTQVGHLGLKSTNLEVDITLARGLNYYTGAIFEVKANVGSLSSSITGGGRYDDLTGIFGLKNMSGVGISFGIDRIFDVMNDANLFPESIHASASVDLMFVNFGDAEQQYILPYVAKLRNEGIKVELYPDNNKKLNKQFDYADKKKIPFVCIVGSEEMKNNTFKLKNMQSGEQKELDYAALVHSFKA